MHFPTLEVLAAPDSAHTIFRCVAGSRAYATAGESSDLDIRGLFVLPRAAYLGLEQPPAQVADPRGDVVYYALRRYLELACTANPNVLEMIFSPPDCVLYAAPEMELLMEHRALFVTRAAYQSHVAYAQAQIKKARGRRKWVHNPQPAEPPQRTDYCWFIPREPPPGALPFRPLRLAEAGIDLAVHRVASLEHTPNVYRLYPGAGGGGVMRGGAVVCESIALAEEATCIGLLVYNDHAYEAAMRDHANYWTWWNHRNVERWRTQAAGEMDYDAKNMAHTFRLLLSGAHLLRTGAPRVRFEGDDLALLKAIRAGAFSYDQLLARAEALSADLAAIHESSPLPNSPDMAKVETLLAEMTSRWEARHGHA